jgi:hypothetical protein
MNEFSTDESAPSERTAAALSLSLATQQRTALKAAPTLVIPSRHRVHIHPPLATRRRAFYIRVALDMAHAAQPMRTPSNDLPETS